MRLPSHRVAGASFLLVALVTVTVCEGGNESPLEQPPPPLIATGALVPMPNSPFAVGSLVDAIATF